jgi:hypothetical protein
VTPYRWWRPTLGEVATDPVSLTAAGVGAIWTVIAAIAGASVEAVVSISFGALTVLVILDMAAGMLRTVVLDYRAWLLRAYTGAEGWKSTLSWGRAIQTPMKWGAYGLLTLGGAMMILAFQDTGIAIPGVWALAVLHGLLAILEMMSIVSNLSVFPGVQQVATRWLAKVHSRAGYLMEYGPEKWGLEDVRRQSEIRRGNPPAPKRGNLRNGTDN